MSQQPETKNDSGTKLSLSLRHPTVADGVKVWELVRDCGVLDANSCYAYLLICRDFAATSLVATSKDRDDRVLAFVAGYRPPERPESLFVWQIGVSPAARKQGVAKRLLRGLLASEAGQEVEYLEATIAPSNSASRRLFHSIAAELGRDLVVTEGFTEAHFGGTGHEPEETVRIPLK